MFPGVKILNGGGGARIVQVAVPRKLFTIKVDLVVHGAAGLRLRDVHVDVERFVLLEKVLNGKAGPGW